MARKCSHCGKMGHNSRTCTTAAAATPAREGGADGGGTGGGLRLFGVQVLDIPNSDCHGLAMNKSFSMDCLLPNSSSSSSSSMSPPLDNPQKVSNGHPSAEGGAVPASSQPSPEKRKGVPWTEEEHGKFLWGLEKLGRGDWRGISRNFVTTRTPTQVASHAQKYFLGLNNNLNKTRRRHSSLFDMGRDKLTRDGSSSIQHQQGHSRSNLWFSSELGPSQPARGPDLELTLAGSNTIRIE